MEQQKEEGSAFAQMKTQLVEEVMAYEDYVEDGCDYYENLARNFRMIDDKGELRKIIDTPLKKKLALKTLDKLSPYDKEFLLEQYEKEDFVVWCACIALFLDKKKDTINALLPGLKKMLEILNESNLDCAFLGLLSQHGCYLLSRADTICTDPSPVFSIPGSHNNSHDQRKIAIEETKHGIIIDLLDLLYPFIKDTNGLIQNLLRYFPVMSKHLSVPQTRFSLDEYALDGFILGKYIKSIKETGEHAAKVNVSALEVNNGVYLQFREVTSWPYIVANLLKEITDPTFAAEKMAWRDSYKSQFAKYVPTKVFPENYLKGLETIAKKKKHRGKRKKKSNITLSGPHIGTLEPALPQSHDALPPELLLSEKITLTVPDSLPPLIEIESSGEYVIDAQDFAKEKEELRLKAKIEKDWRKENRKRSPEVRDQLDINVPHPLLSEHAQFTVKGESYTLLTSLLNGDLPPTTSYNKLEKALKRLGIRFLSRGNGDKRTMILPNGRKELVFYPATAEMGHRLIDKIRKALQQKWGLKEDYLSYGPLGPNPVGYTHCEKI